MTMNTNAKLIRSRTDGLALLRIIRTSRTGMTIKMLEATDLRFNRGFLNKINIRRKGLPRHPMMNLKIEIFIRLCYQRMTRFRGMNGLPLGLDVNREKRMKRHFVAALFERDFRGSSLILLVYS